MSKPVCEIFNQIHFLSGFYVGESCSLWYKSYTKLTDIMIFIVLSATIYQLIISPSEQMETLSISGLVCIAYMLVLYYSVCFQVQNDKIVQLLSQFEATKTSVCELFGTSICRQSYHNVLKSNRKYLYFGTFVSFMSASLFSIQPLLRSAAILGMDGRQKLQIDTWCPFDFKVPFVFEFMVFIQYCTVFWVALRFFVNSSFYMYCIRMNINMFKNLAAFGKEVVKPTTKQNGPYKVNKFRSTLMQIPEEGETNPPHAQDYWESFDRDFNKLVNRRLKLFIKNHQLILSCARRTCDIYAPVMLIYLLSLMGFASIGAFGILQTKGLGGAQSMAVSFFSITNLLCLYFMCEAGDELAQQSGVVAAGLTGADWVDTSRQFRRSLVLLLQRVNTRVQAGVLGVPSMPLSCYTLAWFIKTLVSFYLFLVQVKDVKNT